MVWQYTDKNPQKPSAVTTYDELIAYVSPKLKKELHVSRQPACIMLCQHSTKQQ